MEVIVSLRLPSLPPLRATLPETASVDLHMHTTASDGIWSPQGLVDFARSINLDLIAVTDHNTVRHVQPVREAAAGTGLIVLGGCEVSTRIGNKAYHLLCLGLDPTDDAWERVQKRVLSGRRAMNDQVIAALAKHGYHLDRKSLYVDPAAGEPVYIANPISTGMMNAGYIKSHSELDSILRSTDITFDTLASSISLDELDSVLGDAFAMRVIAHPGRDERGVSNLLDAETLRRILDVTRIDGLEAKHPYHRPEQVGEYLEMAQAFDLVVSCGSDAHHLKRPLLQHPITYCRPLMERCGIEIKA